MTWYYAQAKNEWNEWVEISLNYQYKYELMCWLEDFKKEHRGKYKRYRIKEIEL